MTLYVCTFFMLLTGLLWNGWHHCHSVNDAFMSFLWWWLPLGRKSSLSKRGQYHHFYVDWAIIPNIIHLLVSPIDCWARVSDHVVGHEFVLAQMDGSRRIICFLGRTKGFLFRRGHVEESPPHNTPLIRLLLSDRVDDGLRRNELSVSSGYLGA